jgi:hypothetical protein
MRARLIPLDSGAIPTQSLLEQKCIAARGRRGGRTCALAFVIDSKTRDEPCGDETRPVDEELLIARLRRIRNAGFLIVKTIAVRHITAWILICTITLS